MRIWSITPLRSSSSPISPARSCPRRSRPLRRGSTWRCSSSTTSRSSTLILRCPSARSSPSFKQTVFAYGYPEGGTELSITRGIISRIEYADYNLLTEGLRIQVDAAINPGNSGGPAVIDGQMIGLVFSKLFQADNIGYIIPIEEIELFLKDVKDGRYDGKPVFIDEIQTLENEALREKLKLDKKTTGIVVRNITATRAEYPLQLGDVITRIGDHAIDNVGMVRMDRDRLFKFQYLIQRLARDNKVPMTIVRDGREIKVDVPVGPEHNRWLIPYLGSQLPFVLHLRTVCLHRSD